jgi:predicted transcriptional regulator
MEEVLRKVLAELEMIRKIKMIELIERGYSQRKLGDALGISQATVSRMMAGKRPLKEKTGEKLSSDE